MRSRTPQDKPQKNSILSRPLQDRQAAKERKNNFLRGPFQKKFANKHASFEDSSRTTSENEHVSWKAIRARHRTNCKQAWFIEDLFQNKPQTKLFFSRTLVKTTREKPASFEASSAHKLRRTQTRQVPFEAGPFRREAANVHVSVEDPSVFRTT